MRLYRSYNVHIMDKPLRASINRRKISKNQRNIRERRREKFGFQIPNSTRDALILDQINGNTKWEDSIQKEMTALHKLNCFKYHKTGTKFSSGNGWQLSRIRMIFDLKRQDLLHKARFVVGGHMIDRIMYEAYLSTVQGLSVR